MIESFQSMNLIVGPQSSVKRGHSVKDPPSPHVDEGHGAHRARLPRQVHVVPRAEIGTSFRHHRQLAYAAVPLQMCRGVVARRQRGVVGTGAVLWRRQAGVVEETRGGRGVGEGSATLDNNSIITLFAGFSKRLLFLTCDLATRSTRFMTV